MDNKKVTYTHFEKNIYVTGNWECKLRSKEFDWHEGFSVLFKLTDFSKITQKSIYKDTRLCCNTHLYKQ